MISYSDISTLIKDIVSLAKRTKNNEILEKLMDLQQLVIEARENNLTLKEEIKKLEEKVELLEKSTETENDLIFSDKGFCIKKDSEKKIPYCSHCWADKHKLIPLSQQTTGGWWKYTCGTCKTNVAVINKDGSPLNHDSKGEV